MVLAACWLQGAPAHADAGWLDSGDTQLRMDLQLLNDAEIIRYPLNQWPVPRAAIQYALSVAKEHLATNAAVMQALARVRARVETPAKAPVNFDTGITGGDPGLWRDFDTLAREQGELGAGLDYDQDGYSVGLRVTLVSDPADGDEVRLDGSQATVKWGNWLVSANELDRWWGPGHEGSLILSNNARPMPTLMVERAAAVPFETKWLSWIGPWRFNFALSQMEQHREDIDAPLFMAWRIAIMPLKDLEIGFSRTAQFCGEELKCDLSVLGNLLIGNDNIGFNTTRENEPGNQMAGFDVRWNSPIGSAPYAVYAQWIGEDQSGGMPVKDIDLVGFDIWKPMADGALLQVFAEYANTICAGLHMNPNRGPFYNCAYNQGRFNVEGYRYQGRVIGYPSDRDARNGAIGAIYSAGDGELWTLTARGSRLNYDGGTDPTNSVAQVRTDYYALEAGWKGRLFGEGLSVDLGVQATQPDGGDQDVALYGFIGWRHEFRP
ncbi:MAG TPA: capsule assembly Wzi family protein [Steroidobacteraceae bacterium]|nr:capsule assembly Wzi family protein [Steroidobacteraceae bacterium]